MLVVESNPVGFGKPHGLMSWLQGDVRTMVQICWSWLIWPPLGICPTPLVFVAAKVLCNFDLLPLRQSLAFGEIRLPMSWVVRCLGWFLFYIRCWDWDWGSFASAALCVVIAFFVQRVGKCQQGFVHATMHLIRVILLNVAINTSSNAVFLIIDAWPWLIHIISITADHFTLSTLRCRQTYKNFLCLFIWGDK